MIYGFVVVAWLIMPNGNSVPFASVEKCEQSAALLQKPNPFKLYACLPTGAKP